MSGIDLHVHRWEPGARPGAGTLLLLHGTGGDENDLLPLARMVAPDAALLSVRGNVLEQGARRFFRRLAEGVFDIDDLHRRTGELAEFVRASQLHYGFPMNTLYALGFSNGANVAASMLFSHPTLLAGGILIRGMVPFEPDPLPDLHGRRVLLSEGRSDPLIPVAGAERLGEIMSTCGADVQLVWQAASHGLVPGDVATATEWLSHRLD